ncbi:MAG: nicotinate phosphoribosyltransferase [Planctomycetaceae bacterium]|nr:nicotinate phosphoribosyltransferase [Planctomycetaceae bacterium]
MLSELYRSPLALLTDLYQLTMAYGYWKLGRAEQEAVFHLFFRKPPFAGGYAVTAGLGTVLEFLDAYRFEDTDIAYLESLTGNDDRPLFDREFLDHLKNLRLTVDIDAMPEGTVAFGQEPLLRVRGPILQCQLLETPLLNMINFQTLIATQAVRICSATGGEPVLEFGLRRAQGIDGGLAASRAAYIGGCAATSNVLAGKLYGIPVRGTHAHSWIMSFDSEVQAFESYAQVMPNNCVFLVDTYDTLEGVQRAVAVGRQLRERGHKMVGIRLDSGDLAHLSIEARKILDEAGFPDAVIVASNDLDERAIESLKRQDAAISVWGVGTRLATAYSQPALGGVYKMGAIRHSDGSWQPKIKVSEQGVKTTIPGTLQVRRFIDERGYVGDMIFDDTHEPDARGIVVDLKDTRHLEKITSPARFTDLLQPVLRGGGLAGPVTDLATARQRVCQQLQQLSPAVQRFNNPDSYLVGMDIGLHERREEMIQAAGQS